MDNSLSVVPFLEEISLMFLMSRVDARSIHHELHQFSLFEALLDKQVIFLMNGSMAALAHSLEDFESSPKSSRVVGAHCDFVCPVQVSMMHTD